MFASNPFAALSASVGPAVMQAYVILMMVLVAAGTLFDMTHKKSAQYFFQNWRRAGGRGRRAVGAGEKAVLAAQTAVVDVLAAGEFCNPRRRIAHLLTMYGFLAYAIATFILVFWYAAPDAATPAMLPLLWHAGALLVCIGGYWFWFFIRVDVSAEGHSPFRIVRADLFVLSLVASTTLALAWSYFQANGSEAADGALVLYLIATTVLFASVPWSKFSHMFYKPAAAFQRRVEEAGGSLVNLPRPADRPETLGSARRRPSHY